MLEVQRGKNVFTLLIGFVFFQRQCLFHNELKSVFGNMYSFSACLVRCRIHAVISLCKCIPFYYPSGIYTDNEICNLKHLRCLNKYKGLYYFLFTLLLLKARKNGYDFGKLDRFACGLTARGRRLGHFLNTRYRTIALHCYSIWPKRITRRPRDVHEGTMR